MQFKPNFDLLKHWDEVGNGKTRKPPYVAIFRKSNKILVYMADWHAKENSWNMVDWCFSKDFGIKPDILLTEFENAGRDLYTDPRKNDNTLSHAAFVAAEHNVPVVLADLSASQMMSVINTEDKKYLSSVLRAGPFNAGNKLQQDCAKLNMYARNPFMLENIAIALNKYDTVFCIFGEGHLCEQSAVLEDMLGKPEYITEFPNMHTDFSNKKRNIFVRACDKIASKLHKMEIVRLIEFDMFKGGKQNG